jgi:glutamate-1-semialdehyde 2,1-aminomutase
MITLFFAHGPIRCWGHAALCDTKAFARWHRAMLEHLVYWPPSQFEAAFVSAAHTDAMIDETIRASDDALSGFE